MEKLLRRAVLNRNQLVNKKRREANQDLRKTWREFVRMKNMQDAEMQRLIKSERIARREDWVLGPLAPRRDVGMQKETYGAVGQILAKGPDLPKSVLRGPRGKGYYATGSEDRRLPGFEDGEWKGEGLSGNLVEGDRVVVVKGRLGVQGKIGEVFRIDIPAQMVFVKGVNKVDLKVPSQAAVNADGAKIIEQELPIPMSDLRLVTKIQDPETGAFKDAIVHQVYGGKPYRQRSDGSNLPRHTRYIKGAGGSETNVEIPWPKEEPETAFTQSIDTTRDLVEEVTYFPAVNDPSDPLVAQGVIDELRGKHSRLRRDWDDADFMRRKLMEDARREWFEERSDLLSNPFWSRGQLTKEKQAAERAARLEREAAKLEVAAAGATT